VLALKDVSFEVPTGKLVSIIGPSGCGKSTVLRLIAGFDFQDEGEVLFRDVPVKSIGPDRVMVFQSPVLFPWTTVLENVLFVGRRPGSNRIEIRKRADVVIDEVGLAAFRSHYPYQLSGGMRQRLQIARALVAQPEALLLDEPFGALDAQTRLFMQEMLQEVLARRGTTVVFITHDIEEALLLSDRVYVMSARPGTIVACLDLPRPRPRALDILTSLEFVEFKAQLLKIMREEYEKARLYDSAAYLY